MHKFYKCIVILFLLFCSNSYSEITSIKPSCLNPDNNNIQNIEKIGIKIKKLRNWQKNLYRAYKNTGYNIPKKNKKKFKGTVIVFLKNGFKCEIEARLRVSGDRKDHISINNNYFISSLDINLKENLFNIRDFKLLLPKTRNSDNHIFNTTLLQNLGFPAPRAFYINVEINGNLEKYLFSENYNKEFLESLNYQEGPILRGDEQFLFTKKKYISFARLENSKWIKQDNAKIVSSINAISKLNYFYVLNSLKNKENNLLQPHDYNFIFDPELIENKSFKDNIKLNRLLINAIDAYDTLTFNDIRFYYNTKIDNFYLIYNDGNSTILDTPKKLDKRVLFENDHLIVDQALHQLNNLDFDKFYNDIKNNGLIISRKNLDKKIYLIKTRLLEVKNFKHINNKRLISKENFIIGLNEIFKDNIKLIVFSTINNNFEICSMINKCKEIIINSKDIPKLLNQRLKINKETVLFLGNKNLIDSTLDWKNNYDKWKSIQIDKTKIFYFNSKINMDDKKNSIDFNGGTVLFYGGKISNWKINYSGNINEVYNEKNNLTGCLNFYYIYINKLSLNINNTNCEDAVNFVKTDGNLDDLNIKNSKSDGIDADFSKIFFKNISVSNSGNDCVDFSYGIYNIDNLKAEQCKDKGISIGEKSFLKINNSIISKSSIAIANKDSSKAYFGNAIVNNSEYCYAGYRKKKEFDGSMGNFKNLSCNNSKIFIQKNSHLNK